MPAQRDHAEEQFLALKRAWSEAGADARSDLLAGVAVGEPPASTRTSLQDAFYETGARARRLFLTDLCRDQVHVAAALAALMCLCKPH